VNPFCAKQMRLVTICRRPTGLRIGVAGHALKQGTVRPDCRRKRVTSRPIAKCSFGFPKKRGVLATPGIGLASASLALLMRPISNPGFHRHANQRQSHSH
jgi:hypothetical protein